MCRMDQKTNKSNRQWLPVIVVLLLVIVGTFINLLIWAQHTGPRNVVDDFTRVKGDMGFVRWSEVSEMDMLEPNTLFAFVNGRIVGRFEFASRSYETLVSASISDANQRQWINVNHSDGTYHVDCYPTDDDRILAQPEVTYLDTDGDGLLDRKVDWGGRKTFDAASPLIWKPLKATSEPRTP